MTDNGPSIPCDLQTDGVLWLVNRVVFHPRGFALAVDTDGSLSMCGNGTEPWTFPTEIDDALFAAIEALFQRARAN